MGRHSHCGMPAPNTGKFPMSPTNIMTAAWIGGEQNSSGVEFFLLSWNGPFSITQNTVGAKCPKNELWGETEAEWETVVKWEESSKAFRDLSVRLALQQHSAFVSPRLCVQWQCVDSLILTTVRTFMQQKRVAFDWGRNPCHGTRQSFKLASSLWTLYWKPTAHCCVEHWAASDICPLEGCHWCSGWVPPQRDLSLCEVCVEQMAGSIWISSSLFQILHSRHPRNFVCFMMPCLLQLTSLSGIILHGSPVLQ